MSTIRFIAEWEPQYCTLLTWPHEHSDWAAGLQQIESAYVDIAAAITRFQSLAIIALNVRHQLHIHELLRQNDVNTDACLFFTIASNDTWIRDYGPLSVELDGPVFWKNFGFNAWGNKFEWTLDNQVSKQLHGFTEFESYDWFAADWILEGGAIETDGYHTAMMNKPAVISHTRNPGVGQTTIEEKLLLDLGIQQCLWLEAPAIPGDDTDGHIDNIARFVDANTIVVYSVDRTHAQHKEWKKVEKTLAGANNIAGTPYRIVALPQPVLADSTLPASYLNFLFVNNGVLLPVFDCPQDQEAIDIMTDLLPFHEIVPVAGSALLQQGGGIHCATMQIPENRQ